MARRINKAALAVSGVAAAALLGVAGLSHAQQGGAPAAPGAGAPAAPGGAGGRGAGGGGGGFGGGGGGGRPTIDLSDNAGWTSIFNGRDLTNWDGDKAYWSVKDGSIFAESTCEKPTGTIYIDWTGGQTTGDFDLKFKMRLTGSANGGTQYRSWIEGTPGKPSRATPVGPPAAPGAAGAGRGGGAAGGAPAGGGAGRGGAAGGGAGAAAFGAAAAGGAPGAGRGGAAGAGGPGGAPGAGRGGAGAGAAGAGGAPGAGRGGAAGAGGPGGAAGAPGAGGGRGGAGGGAGGACPSGITPAARPDATAQRKWYLDGPQFDYDNGGNFSGMFYEQGTARGIAARPGQDILASAGKPLQLASTFADSTTAHNWWIPNDWNTGLIVVRGHTYLQYLNGHLSAIFTDDDPNFYQTSGMIGFEIEQTGTVEMKDIYLRQY